MTGFDLKTDWPCFVFVLLVALTVALCDPWNGALLHAESAHNGGAPMLDAVVDLSHHQAPVDFGRIRGGHVLGVIHKATEGVRYVDPTYTKRRPYARAVGLLWGAYHFATGADGNAQARHFLDTVRPTDDDLCVLDWEDNDGDKMLAGDVVRFVETIAASTGRYPGLYSGNTAREMLGSRKDSVLANCWLWMPRYSAAPPVPQASWPTVTMWQYTQTGSVAGVIGHVDRNRFNGDEAGLRSLWTAGGASVPAVE